MSNIPKHPNFSKLFSKLRSPSSYWEPEEAKEVNAPPRLLSSTSPCGNIVRSRGAHRLSPVEPCVISRAPGQEKNLNRVTCVPRQRSEFQPAFISGSGEGLCQASAKLSLMEDILDTRGLVGVSVTIVSN